MEKGRIFVATLSFVSVAGIVIACSDSTGSTFPAETPDTGATADAPTGVFNPDTGTTSDGPVGSVECAPQTPQNFTPKWNPPASGKFCSKAVLDEYYDKCLANAVKGDGSVATPCDTWRTANADCQKCIEQDKNAGPVSLVQNGDVKLINYGACIAVAQNKLGDTDCAADFSAAVECTRSSCDFCFGKGGSIADFNKCQGKANDQGTCKTLNDEISSGACKGYKDVGQPAAACFDGGALGSKAQITKMMGIVCGTGS